MADNEKMLELAKKIGKLFPSFYLAGGTALMLKYRHRISIDLDFFSEKIFSKNNVARILRNNFKTKDEITGEDNFDIFIEGIKVSFVFFPFKNIEKLQRYEGIKISSDYDILLNKIYAAGRRIDIKDPIDVAFLLDKYGWSNDKLKRDFEKKFISQDFRIYTGALLCFDDYKKLSNKQKHILNRLLK